MDNDEAMSTCPECLEEFVRRIEGGNAVGLRPDESRICVSEDVEFVYTH